MGKLKYDKLLASVLKICYEYFEFHIDILPKEFEKLQRQVMKTIKEISTTNVKTEPTKDDGTSI